MTCRSFSSALDSFFFLLSSNCAVHSTFKNSLHTKLRYVRFRANSSLRFTLLVQTYNFMPLTLICTFGKGSQTQLHTSVLIPLCVALQASLVQKTAAAQVLSPRSTAPHVVTSRMATAPAHPRLPTLAWATPVLLQTGSRTHNQAMS